MNNKYQEELNNAIKDIEYRYADWGNDVPPKRLEEIKLLQEAINKANKYDELQKVYFKNEPMESADLNGVKLQELYDLNSKLIDKETPKKRIFVEEKGGISAHDECPICRVKVSPIRRYCDNCGQRLE